MDAARQRTKEGQAIQAQILLMLHSFRKVPSSHDYGQFEFSCNLPKLQELTWPNAWSPLDPVSANLHFYRVDRQDWFWSWVPGLARLGYWNDPDFYSFFGRPLLVR